MSTQPISTGPIQTGAVGGGNDPGDVALLLATIQIDMLDSEITGRLLSIDRTNKERKAYNDQISLLNDVSGSFSGPEGWVRATDLRKMDFAWDPTVAGGAGGVAGTDGGGIVPDGATYRIRLPNGDFARLDSGPPRPRVDGDMSAEGMMDGPERSGLLPGDVISVTDPAQARRIAAELGGEVVVKVTREQIGAEIDRLRNAADGRSSDTEIGMLNLNRLLSRRNQIVQLASNVMASDHQAAMGVINNLKV